MSFHLRENGERYGDATYAVCNLAHREGHRRLTKPIS